jgi:hypothetical protein
MGWDGHGHGYGLRAGASSATNRNGTRQAKTSRRKSIRPRCAFFLYFKVGLSISIVPALAMHTTSLRRYITPPTPPSCPRWSFIHSLYFVIDPDSIVPFSCEVRVARYTFCFALLGPKSVSCSQPMYVLLLDVTTLLSLEFSR